MPGIYKKMQSMVFRWGNSYPRPGAAGRGKSRFFGPGGVRFRVFGGIAPLLRVTRAIARGAMTLRLHCPVINVMLSGHCVIPYPLAVLSTCGALAIFRRVRI